MEDKYKLTRFLDAQNQMYLKALEEINKGEKKSHWMWFIFPQLKGLGSSDVANYYGISNLEEASAYLEHPVLGKHLKQISHALLFIEGKTATDIFGCPDNLKLHSCMTLFSQIEAANSVFQQVLDRYYEGIPDKKTLYLLGN